MLLEAARQEVDPLAAQDVELARGGTTRSRRSRRSRIRSRTTTPDQRSDAADIEAGRASDVESDVDFLEEKRAIVARTEEPGLDSLRMTGGAIGTIIRARRRATALSVASASRSHLSASANGSLHSHDLSRNGTRRSSLSPVPQRSWFRALTSGRRPDRSRSPCRSPSQLPEVSEKSNGESEISGLPQGLVESPLSSPFVSDGLPSPATHPSRSLILGSAENLPGPPLPPPPLDDRPRRPSIRFQTSAPHVQQDVTSAMPVRPTLGGEDDEAGTMRSRTMPIIFTEAERVRAEQVGKEKSKQDE